jgi:hypothetical protein
MSDSFGYLTTKGFCDGGKCLKWPVLLGEFSAPHKGAPQDYATVEGLVDYINNAGAARDGRHEPINLWFFWCWNDNSPDTVRRIPAAPPLLCTAAGMSRILCCACPSTLKPPLPPP